MDWYTRRKLIYALSTLVLVSSATLYFLYGTLFPEPTCFDTKQNGYETGVDCGGVCSLTCRQDVRPLTTLWAKSIATSKNTYDLVGMVSNKNIDNASHDVMYTFTLYGLQGDVIGTIKGTTTAPVDGDFPIIIQSVKLGQVPKLVTLDLEDGVHYKVGEKPTSPTLRIANEYYEVQNGTSRVYAMIMNTKRVTVSNLPVRVVLFDQNDNAYAVGETLVPFLDKEEVKDLSFTWDSPLPFAPTKIRVYPIFDPFISIQ